jgi:putative hydrolase
VSNLPFGFQPPSRGGDEGGAGGSGGAGDSPQDPFGMFGGDPGDLGAALHRFADLLSWSGGPVNWDLARDVASNAARDGDPIVSPADEAAVVEALRLADLWLDPVTTLPAGVRAPRAWSRVGWVSATVPVWGQLCDPVAARVVEAMSAAVSAQAPPELAAMAGQMTGVMRQLGGALFGTQVGQAIGALAGDVLTSTEVGLPLTEDGQAALLPANLAAFGRDLDVPADELRLYVALQEAAHQRLFRHVPWLRAHLLGAVDAYARGITVDPSAIERAIGELDPTDPEAAAQALSSGLFEPQSTPAQDAALARLETALALVEGWVDEVVDAAATAHLPHAAALRETMRRRRATGGPAEQTFASLVGLELRPRRLREAAALWRALAEARGMEGRDAVWGHPDLMPSADDLDDPAAYLAGRARDDDLDLSGLSGELEPPTGEAPGDDPPPAN